MAPLYRWTGRSEPGLKTSAKVGLHPQLVGYDPINANGVLVGFNPKDRLVDPGRRGDFYWYGRRARRDENGKIQARTDRVWRHEPHFGRSNCSSPQFGMVGALIIEPEGATWTRGCPPAGLCHRQVSCGADFREFVVIDQNMVPTRRRQIVFWPVSREAQSGQ